MLPAHVASDVAFVAIQLVIDRVRATGVVHICGFTRDDVCMDMWHTLSSGDTVLDGDVQRRPAVHTLYHAAHFLDCQKEIGYFR